MAKEIHSILCEFCCVRFFVDADDDEAVCPVCGSQYYEIDGKWEMYEIEEEAGV